jgi:inorganic phosphate transporter, PiT family
VTTILVVASAVALAWWNGANDNFKGVATLYGSQSASYRVALAWSTVTQLAGSLLATVLASGLIATFSAKGLVPASVAGDPAFLSAVAIGTMATVLFATAIGMPVSTTHALTGALIGAGAVEVGADINLAVLGKSFFLPLLVSPLIAMALTTALYPLAHRARTALGITRDACVCVGNTYVPVASLSSAAPATARLTVAVDSATACVQRYQGRVVGVSVQRLLDGLHFLSGGAICFARALNDTPKILALCMTANAIGVSVGLPVVGAAMALGGLLNARKVATTMAKRITPLNAGQGVVANITTAMLVIAASRAGLPVSTTHVSTSAMFGIGLIHRSADRRTVMQIIAAWLTTLPAGALVGALAYWILAG